MNKISELILLNSFFDELEKTSGWGSEIAKLLRVGGKADLAAGSKGIRAGLKVIGEHQGPLFMLPKGALNKPVPEKITKGVSKSEGFILREFGNMAAGIGNVVKNIDKTKPLTYNIGTVVRDFGKQLAGQLRATKYTTLSANEAVRTGVGGRYIKGKGILGKSRIFDRKIEGRTTAGKYIVKKRKAMRPLSYAVSPVGFGAGTFLLGSGKRNESIMDRTRAGVQETALWSVTPAVAQIKLISDILK